MQLAKVCREITIGSVVQNMENHFEIVECMGSEQANCKLNGACLLKNILTRAT